MSARPTDLEGVIFDKDGTLFEFGRTWDVWGARVIARLSAGDDALAAALARCVDFDATAGAFAPGSVVIAGTGDEAATAFAAGLAEQGASVSPNTLHAVLREEAMRAPLREAVPLAPFVAGLRARGLKLGVMTNDTEAGARHQLAEVGVLEAFDCVAGFDSGFGAKPDAAPLLGVADAMGCAPKQVAMVGDSTHDLQAGRAAGMLCVGVLTGPAPRSVLVPHSDVILTSIADLPGWLDGDEPTRGV